MPTNDGQTEAPPAPASPPPASPAPDRKLTRSRDQHVIAGVCGGLSRYTGVDPVVFRVGLAVLVLFGGVGAVIYIAAWLFLPEDGDAASPAEALLGRGQSSTSTLTTVILAMVAVAALGVALHGETAFLLALAVLGIVLLARRGPLPTDPAAAVSSVPGGGESPPATPAAYAPHGPYAGDVGGDHPPPSQTMPIRPIPPKPRSALGRIVVSASLLVLGLMLIADRLFNVSIPAPGYAAVALGVTGAGLVVGAWYGRSRGLIGLGLVLCIVLAATTAASEWNPEGEVGNQRWAPTRSADIATEYKIGFGDGTLDLRSVDFAQASANTRLGIGFGHLLVQVPSNVDVTVNATAGAGNINLFGAQRNGTDITNTVTNLGSDGEGGGTLNLTVHVGFGEVEVIRD